MRSRLFELPPDITASSLIYLPSEQILEICQDPELASNPSIRIACADQNLWRAKLRLDYGLMIPVNSNAFQRYQQVYDILGPKCMINNPGYTHLICLLSAARLGDPDLVDQLFDREPLSLSRRYTGTHNPLDLLIGAAVETGNYPNIDYLLNRANPSDLVSLIRSAIRYTIAGSKLNIMIDIVQNWYLNPSKHVRSEEGDHSLTFVAGRFGNLDAINYLLSVGIGDVNDATQGAVDSDKVNLVRYLIRDRGANLELAKQAATVHRNTRMLEYLNGM